MGIVGRPINGTVEQLVARRIVAPVPEKHGGSNPSRSTIGRRSVMVAYTATEMENGSILVRIYRTK